MMTLEEVKTRVEAARACFAAKEFPGEKDPSIWLAAVFLSESRGTINYDLVLEEANYCEELVDIGLHQSVKTDRKTPCLK